MQQPFVEPPPLIENTSPVLKDTFTDKQNQPAKIANDHPPTEAQHRSHKKKWREYLLEFFMLFFAVFLGFLVENFRENKVEEERAEKHMHTMVENLKYDTVRMQVNLRKNLELGRGLDSFRFQINEAIQGRVDANKLYYYYWKYGQDFNIVVMNDAAITQLKNAGMLRMAKNYALAAEMGDYYERKRGALMYAREGVQKRLDALLDTYKLFFSFQALTKYCNVIPFIQAGTPFLRENMMKYWPQTRLLNLLTPHRPLSKDYIMMLQILN